MLKKVKGFFTGLLGLIFFIFVSRLVIIFDIIKPIIPYSFKKSKMCRIKEQEKHR